MATRDDVFVAFGKLALKCQMLEHGLVALNMFVQSMVYWGEGRLESEGVSSKLSQKRKSTLGVAANDLHKILDLPELKDTLDKAVTARNHLQHDFFQSFSFDFQSNTECVDMLQRLSELRGPIDTAYNIVEKTVLQLEEPLKTAGYKVGGSPETEEARGEA